MTHRTRNVLFITLFILFLITAPIVVFYSLGWRFDWETKRIVQTGVFYFRVWPKNAQLYIDGEVTIPPYPIRHTDPQIYPAEYSNRDNFGPFEIPPEHYFVMGDNRDNSLDSREWGFLERKNIKGKAFLVYFSWAPDPLAPEFTNPYITSFFEVLFYNLTHFPWRVRWERIGTMVR